MAMGALLSPRVAAGAVAATGLLAARSAGAGAGAPGAVAELRLLPRLLIHGRTRARGQEQTMFRSLIHVRVPDELHGRAFAAYNRIRNAAELGAFAAGGVLVVRSAPAAWSPTRAPSPRSSG